MALCSISVWGHWALSFCIVEIAGVQMIKMLTIIFFLQRPHKAKPVSFTFTYFRLFWLVMTFDIGMMMFSRGISFAFLAFSNAKHYVKNFFL